MHGSPPPTHLLPTHPPHTHHPTSTRHPTAQGAPESILARCTSVLANNGEGVVPLTDAARAALAAATRRFGHRALRTLALAYKPLPGGTKAVRGSVGRGRERGGEGSEGDGVIRIVHAHAQWKAGASMCACVCVGGGGVMLLCALVVGGGVHATPAHRYHNNKRSLKPQTTTTTTTTASPPHHHQHHITTTLPPPTALARGRGRADLPGAGGHARPAATRGRPRTGAVPPGGGEEGGWVVWVVGGKVARWWGAGV